MRTIEQMVDSEVIWNQNQLIDDLLELESPIGEVSWDNIENLYDPDDEDGYPQDIFTWYQVTDWFYEKLRNKGEPVMACDYGFFWGRTTYGQLIVMDGVIQEIYSETHK